MRTPCFYKREELSADIRIFPGRYLQPNTYLLDKENSDSTLPPDCFPNMELSYTKTKNFIITVFWEKVQHK